jgi:hypothetical protein
MSKTRTKFSVRPGDWAQTREPVVELIECGKRSYLWIGNDLPGLPRCWGTISGRVAMTKLADRIHAVLGIGTKPTKEAVRPRTGAKRSGGASRATPNKKKP